MTPSEEIQALRSELARERAEKAAILDAHQAQARALKAANEALQSRAVAEDKLEARRAADRERKREARRQKLMSMASADHGPGMSTESPQNVHGHPSSSSPPLDGPPLSSPIPNSPLPFIPSPSSPPPLSGSEPRPPVSDTSAEGGHDCDNEDCIRCHHIGGLEAFAQLRAHPEDVAAVERLGQAPLPATNYHSDRLRNAMDDNSPAKPDSSPPDWPPALRLEVQAAPKAARTRKPSAAERLYLQLEETRRQRCEGAGVDFVAEDWAPARQNTSLGRFARLQPAEQERFEAAWAEYLSDDSGASRNPPWSVGWFLASKSTWESKALRGAS